MEPSDDQLEAPRFRHQPHVIQSKLGPMVAYLTLLEERMEQRDFPRDDKLFVMVKRAHDAVRDLFLECHEPAAVALGGSRSDCQAA